MNSIYRLRKLLPVVFVMVFVTHVRAQDTELRKPWFLRPNPVVQDSGRYVTGVYQGPLGFRQHVETNREKIHASAFDEDRDYVDPGSVQRVDHRVPDGRGGYVNYRGYTWTSNGVPHGDLNENHSHRSGWFRTNQDNTHVQYCPAR
jgi:hypothetical protein